MDIPSKNALLTYEDVRGYGCNIGDFIQSLAAQQFLPSVDLLVSRERLAEVGESAALIMNGWFTHNAARWIPSDCIDPLLVSFHISPSARERMLSTEGVDYLRRHAPVGCRDHDTRKMLQSLGVDAYYSGCLTLTLANPFGANVGSRSGVYVVDPFYNHHGNVGKVYDLLAGVCDDSILKGAGFVSHVVQCEESVSDFQKFAMAEDLLMKYARAELVVTSRIHCALPCLAMGTPVLFLNDFDMSLDTRFDGMLDLLNRVDFQVNGEWVCNFKKNGPKVSLGDIKGNPTAHLPLVEELVERCKGFTGHFSNFMTVRRPWADFKLGYEYIKPFGAYYADVLSSKAARLQDVESAYAELSKGKEWLENQWRLAAARRDELEAACVELSKGKDWLEDQWRSAATRRAELESAYSELSKGKDWLEDQWRSAATRRDELEAECSELSKGKAWLEAQAASLAQVCARRENELEAQRVSLAEKQLRIEQLDLLSAHLRAELERPWWRKLFS